MCGLYGVAGSGIKQIHIQAFKDLMYISGLRGEDSTGLMGARLGGHLKILKDALTPSDYLNYYGGPSGFIQAHGWDVIMGHNRWATVGKINKNNAHPFDMGKFVGAHNGTLVAPEYKHQSMTDSEMMFKDIAKRGVYPVLSDLTHYDAYAISIFEKKNKTLIFARNFNRSLHYAVCKNSGVMFWASEYEMLLLMARRNNIAMNYYYFEPGKIYEIPVESIIPGEITYTETEVPVNVVSSYDLPWGNAL